MAAIVGLGVNDTGDALGGRRHTSLAMREYGKGVSEATDAQESQAQVKSRKVISGQCRGEGHSTHLRTRAWCSWGRHGSQRKVQAEVLETKQLRRTRS